ncbi:basic blue protein-like [Humulus lupulus]|uniref:basic blue protein-like n=1 Tax=Humulus lupulus TaxID=3486 RepID=UPI002B4049ED|nr:basic blue protein-like [Humulus lupulus]
MAQGRVSAMTTAALVLLLVLIGHSELVRAATYTVGGSRGWTFNVSRWPKGKHFKAGDTLVFIYDKRAHNVVAVNNAGYKSCMTPKGSKVFRSGKDRIKLKKGPNFFICNLPQHCKSGMKIAVTAL